MKHDRIVEDFNIIMAYFRKKGINNRMKKSILGRVKLFQKQKKDTALIKRLKEVNGKKGGLGSLFKKVFWFLIIIGFFSVGGIFFWASTLEIPDIKTIQSRKISQSTKIYSNDGSVLYRLYDDEARTIIPISKISKYAINAAVAVEDKDFYNHDGVKITSIIKSAYENITQKRRYSRGGSTITQQVIKNTILTSEKTYTRKVKEAVLAYKLEKLWSKDKILELYLNESPYGGTLYGIEEASMYYFDKHAIDLNIAESAYLAAMPQAPTTYSPYGKHREALDNRKDLILRLMFQQGYISSREYKNSVEEKVEFIFKEGNLRLKAPHFVMDVVKKLKERFGEEIRTSGYKVYTTLDLDLQEKLEKLAKETIKEAGENFKVSNAGIVSIESKTGYVKAMVGSRDYFNKEIDGKYNIATALRQPGSSFKPIIYLSALEKGYTPKTILWDVETEFSTNCNININEETGEVIELSSAERKRKGCYKPQNFDNKFRGPMKMEQALAESRNIPAVKLLYLVGVNKALSNARLFGIKSLNKPASHYGLNLVLGGGEVKLLNMVSTYSTFSNDGVRVEPSSILRITDNDDKVIFENKVKNKRVIDSKYVKNLNKMLYTVSLKYPTYGRYSPLYFQDRQVAVKTGTTNDFRDFWTLGYDSGNISVGVWVGNNDNSSAESFAAGKTSHKLWKSAMKISLEGYPITKFAEAPSLTNNNSKSVFRGIYQGGNTIKIDTESGKIATDETPDEFIKEVAIPEYHSILHWVSKNNPRGPIPVVKSPAYNNWEYGVNKWTKDNQEAVTGDLSDALAGLMSLLLSGGNLTPEDLENFNNKDKEPVGIKDVVSDKQLDFKILSPGDGDTFKEDESMYVKFKKLKDSKIKKYYFYINDNYIGSTNKNSISFDLSSMDNLDKKNVFKIVSENSFGQKFTKIINFNIR